MARERALRTVQWGGGEWKCECVHMIDCQLNPISRKGTNKDILQLLDVTNSIYLELSAITARVWLVTQNTALGLPASCTGSGYNLLFFSVCFCLGSIRSWLCTIHVDS